MPQPCLYYPQLISYNNPSIRRFITYAVGKLSLKKLINRIYNVLTHPSHEWQGKLTRRRITGSVQMNLGYIARFKK